MPDRPGRAIGPSEIVVEGDWNDLDAAISRASAKAAVAPTSTEREESAVRFELLAVDAQPATVTFTAAQRWTRETGPVLILIEATFGRPSDPGRAAALVRLVAAELEALAGVDYAP